MKNLFGVLPEDFFKPLTGKYRRQYADCILLIFNTFKPEISYGVRASYLEKKAWKCFRQRKKQDMPDNRSDVTCIKTIEYMLAHNCKLEQEAIKIVTE